MKVGFIGLGTMGRHMAANLQKAGHEVVVHDVRREAAESHIKNGARWADSPRAVAEATEVVFTSLPGPVEVEAVALDEKQGLLAGLTAGRCVCEMAHDPEKWAPVFRKDYAQTIAKTRLRFDLTQSPFRAPNLRGISYARAPVLPSGSARGCARCRDGPDEALAEGGPQRDGGQIFHCD